jgi:phosphatidylserine decarboxylase
MVKGHHFTLSSLLANQRHLIERFQNGHASIIYLAPHNYHRVHMPCDGKLLSMTHVPGTLFSVNNTTVRGVPGVFARNERVICTFDTPQGWVAVILVGALIVGSIATPWAGIVSPRARQINTQYYSTHANTGGANPQPESPITLKQGQEMGRFLMGSTVILLTEQNALQWAEHLQPEVAVTLHEPLACWKT